MKQLTQLHPWIVLTNHADTMQLTTLSALHQSNPLRQEELSYTANNISIDLSNQRATTTTIRLLLELAHERHLRQKIDDLLQGKIVNLSERRPALHSALRVQDEQPILVDGHNIIPDILKTRENMQRLSDQIRAGQWLGHTGKPIILKKAVGIC